MQAKLVTIDPEIMHGTPCFTGTRVPIQTLLDCLGDGETLDDFCEDFPTVSREVVIAFLQQATENILAAA